MYIAIDLNNASIDNLSVTDAQVAISQYPGIRHASSRDHVQTSATGAAGQDIGISVIISYYVYIHAYGHVYIHAYGHVYIHAYGQIYIHAYGQI